MSHPGAKMSAAEGLRDGSLGRRIAAAPSVQAAQQAQARVTAGLAEIADLPAGERLRRLCAAYPNLEALLVGLAGGSSYLWDLARASPQELLALFESEPERRFAHILAEARRAIAATRDEGEVMRLLRRMRAEAALLIALADIGGVWPITQVIEQQTTLAEAAVGAAINYLLLEARRRGKLKAVDHNDPAEGSGYIVLAMGKMGARELNYSSDIDLIVFYDPAAVTPATEPAAPSSNSA